MKVVSLLSIIFFLSILPGLGGYMGFWISFPKVEPTREPIDGFELFFGAVIAFLIHLPLISTAVIIFLTDYVNINNNIAGVINAAFMLFFVIAYWHLLACTIVWVYDKMKKVIKK